MKVALITGGTRGIGKEIALKFAKLDYQLILSYRNDNESATNTKNLCEKFGVKALLFKGDISEKSTINSLFEFAIQNCGRVDVLVNNAGRNIDKPFHDLSEQDWDIVVNTNMKSVFLLSQLVSKDMIEKKVKGNIINISATTAIQGRKNGMNYCSSKAGVIVMTKCMALELGSLIRVNCVIPGFTYTSETEERFNLKEQLNNELMKRKIPLNRLANPNEIANIISFLVSEEANYITGQKFIVDGGEYMY